MFMKVLCSTSVLVILCGAVASQLPVTDDPVTPQPAQAAVPKAAEPKARPQPEKASLKLSLSEVLGDESARKAMGLDKLSAEEQERLASGITKFTGELLHKALEVTATQRDAENYMLNEGWSRVNVIGTAQVKPDRFTPRMELLVVEGRLGREYYGSQFGGDLSPADAMSLRSGVLWGRSGFRSLTLLGRSGREIRLSEVSVEALR
jgi:hypothetical protein